MVLADIEVGTICFFLLKYQSYLVIVQNGHNKKIQFWETSLGHLFDVVVVKVYIDGFHSKMCCVRVQPVFIPTARPQKQQLARKLEL